MPHPSERPSEHEVDRAEDIPTLERTTLHQGAKFDFAEVSFTTPAGERIARQYIRHPGAVVILPLARAEDGPRVLFVRNRRLAVGKFLLELPAGTLDHPGESPQQTAARELEEETGHRAATWIPLCRFYTGPGLTDELMHAFVAKNLTHVGQRLEPDEDMTVHAYPVSAALDLIDRGDLIDAKSIAVLLLAERRSLLY